MRLPKIELMVERDTRNLAQAKTNQTKARFEQKQIDAAGITLFICADGLGL